MCVYVWACSCVCVCVLLCYLTLCSFPLQYTGKWWEYQRFPAVFEFGVICGFANYTQLSDTKIKVLNSGIQEIKL